MADVDPPSDDRVKKPTEVEPTAEEPTEAERTASFMASRKQAAPESSDDEAEVAAVLATAQLERKERKKVDKEVSKAVGRLCARAEDAIEAHQHMDAIGLYTEALALDESNVDLLAARGSLCARLDHHKATLHDGELIVRILPDWYRGHALCGMALFCLKQYAPSVRAYSRAIELSPDTPEREGIREALMQAQGRVDEELRQAALREDASELQRLLYGGGGGQPPAASKGGAGTGEATRHSAVNVEAVEQNHGFTALALATAAGRFESAKILLEARANVNAKDKYGKSPLMWAAASGNEKMATLLCKNGADIFAQDRSGWDALFAAAHGGHTRLVTVWLLNKTADPNRATADGTTALMAAAQAGKAAVVKLLLDRSAEPMLVNGKGQRALEYARAGKHQDVIDMLLPLTPGEA